MNPLSLALDDLLYPEAFCRRFLIHDDPDSKSSRPYPFWISLRPVWKSPQMPNPTSADRHNRWLLKRNAAYIKIIIFFSRYSVSSHGVIFVVIANK